MTEFGVRGALESDIPTVKAIANACFSDPWSEAALASKLAPPHIFKVVLDKEKAVGFAIFARLGNEAELYDIAVLPEYRGSGAASVLWESAVSDIGDSASTVYLEVRASNSRAIGFYKKLGFTETGVRKSYYKNPTEDAILMSLNLN